MRDRRQFFRQIAVGLGGAVFAGTDRLQAKAEATIGLGYGTHGFKSLPAVEAIGIIAGTGYDSVQFCLWPGWIDPVRCSAQERRELRSAVDRYRLAVPCLFDRIDILGDAAQHQAHLERIRADAQFGHDVNAGVGGVSPCIGTRLGGDTKDFEANKNLLVDRLHEWAEVGRQTQKVIAVKGHPPMIVDRSEKTAWVVQKVNSPWLRVEFDYGHFQTGGEELGTTRDRLRPYIAVISMQDNKKNNSKSGWEGKLPGDGDTDYEDYYRRLVKSGYNGHTVVWVIDSLIKRPDFDAEAAAKHCYTNLSSAMMKAGVTRPHYRG